MTFRAFVGIVIAVALGVNWGLRMHEDSNSFGNRLKSLWFLFKILLGIVIIIGIIVGVCCGIRYLFKYGIIRKIFGIIFVVGLTVGLIIALYKKIKVLFKNIEGKGGFKIRIKSFLTSKNILTVTLSIIIIGVAALLYNYFPELDIETKNKYMHYVIIVLLLILPVLRVGFPLALIINYIKNNGFKKFFIGLLNIVGACIVFLGVVYLVLRINKLS